MNNPTRGWQSLLGAFLFLGLIVLVVLGLVAVAIGFVAYLVGGWTGLIITVLVMAVIALTAVLKFVLS